MGNSSQPWFNQSLWDTEIKVGLLILAYVGKARVATVKIRNGSSSVGHPLSDVPRKLTTPFRGCRSPGCFLATLGSTSLATLGTIFSAFSALGFAPWIPRLHQEGELRRGRHFASLRSRQVEKSGRKGQMRGVCFVYFFCFLCFSYFSPQELHWMIFVTSGDLPNQ